MNSALSTHEEAASVEKKRLRLCGFLDCMQNTQSKGHFLSCPNKVHDVGISAFLEPWGQNIKGRKSKTSFDSRCFVA